MASQTITDIVAQMRAALLVSDPELDTNVGSPTRKILDAVAESIAEAYVDEHMLTYQYDIDSKIDADLDAFAQLFGIARLAAKRAVGTVTFTRSGDLTQVVTVPVNTQIDSSTDPVYSVMTITPAFLDSGESSVTVPVQAIQPGPQGNLAAGSLTVIATPVAGVNDVTNLAPLTGGTVQETDDELRDRWKKTVFRSMAGTEAMYLGIALNDPDCTGAVVLGSSKRRRDQVQIDTGNAVTYVTDAQYIFPTGVFVGTDIDAGDLVLIDYDYSWDYASNPPEINVLNAGALPDDDLFEIDYEYTPTSSRNDPATGVLHRVDVWCQGERPVTASQSIIFQSTRQFQHTDSADPWYTTDYRCVDGTVPVVGDVFVPLAFGPILIVPDEITVDGDTYGRVGAGLAVDYPDAYQVVHEDTAFGYSSSSNFGLTWDQTSLPANDIAFSIGADDDYVYNQIPAAVQDGINRWRLVGIDALAHASRKRYLRFSLAIIYDRTFSQSGTNTSIDTAISTYLNTIGDGFVQVSDILQIAHNVSGVDAVRFVEGADIPGFSYASRNTYDIGIQEIVDGAVVTTFVDTDGRPQDVTSFGSNSAPYLFDVNKSVRAQNTFGVGS